MSLQLDVKLESKSGNLLICYDDSTVKRNALTKLIEEFNRASFPCPDLKDITVPLSYEAIIVFHDINSMLRSKQVGQLPPYYFAQELFIEKDSDTTYISSRKPIIHMTLFDHLLEDSGQELSKLLSNVLARYLSIMDSSIWNYYVPIARAGKDEYNLTRLSMVVKSIIVNNNFPSRNDKGNLYALATTNEYADFYARLVKESRLSEFGAHSDRVSPFLFHSESQMYMHADKVLESITKQFSHCKKLKFRILLVDDYSKKALRGLSNSSVNITAFDIIEERLNVLKRRIAQFSNNDFEMDFDICLADTLKMANDMLGEKKFDIIILDYLLEEDSGLRHYGYEFLNGLKKNNIRGPLQRCWILFASVFPIAVEERLLKEGHNRGDKNWYIGRTSSFINTPELFTYNFLSLIEKLTSSISVKNLIEDDSKYRYPLIDFLEYIFNDKISQTRSKAVKKFNSFLQLKSQYAMLENDYEFSGSKENGSLLVQSLCPDIKFYNNQFWEHMQHLMYLVAFGNMGQWNAIWDEFMCVKKNLLKADESGRVVVMIEDYIVSLREHS